MRASQRGRGDLPSILRKGGISVKDYKNIHFIVSAQLHLKLKEEAAQKEIRLTDLISQILEDHYK